MFLILALVFLAASLAAAAVRPRLLPPDWGWRFAADPMPVEMDTAAQQSAWHAQWGSIRSWSTLEKVVLVGLIAVVYGNILPGVRSTTLELFVGVAVIIVINAGFTLALARRSWSTPSLALAFFARVVVNVVIVYVEDWLLSRGGGDLDVGTTVFFMCLISLITTLHDRYRPVLATRVIAERDAAARRA